MVGIQIPQELVEETYKAVELARTSGKIAKGSNETTKQVERGQAKLVVVAKDVEPKEVVMHLPLLCKDKGVVCVEVPSKEELGAAAGLGVKTACVSIVKEGDARDSVSRIIEQVRSLEKSS